MQAHAAGLNEFVTRPLVLPGAFDEETCDRIVRVGLARPAVGDSLAYAAADSRWAVSHWIKRAPDNDWLFERLGHAFARLNEAYRFDVDGMDEPLLLARYPVGVGFTWHVDALEGVGTRRKISLSVQLTQPDAYDGGDLEFIPDGRLQLARLRGSIIAFPSYCAHRVTPITRGERLALVAWIHGPAFR